MAENRELKELQKSLEAVLKPFIGLLRVKPSNAKALDQLASALEAVPSSAAAVEGLDAAVASLRLYLTSARSGREAGFRRIETAFITATKSGEALVQELGSGWRIGSLELEVDRPLARVRALYNREVIAEWRPVQTQADLEQVVTDARNRLSKSELPGDKLRSLMNEAYAEGKRAAGSARVPMPEFFRAFRVALVQDELRSGKPDKKLQYADFPRWAFLYNVDRYRATASQLGADRLEFDPGSQADNAKGLGMVINGLSPDGVHKKVCYVLRPSEGR